MNISYTVSGASAATGLPGKTVSDAVRRGELPAIRSGRRFIILADDLVAWLRQSKTRGGIPAPVSDDDRLRLAELNRMRRHPRDEGRLT